MRRSPLQRKTPLRTEYHPLPRRGTPLARKRFTSKPTPRAVEKQDAMKAARILLAVRDAYYCRLRHHSPCAGPLDPHHLLKASAGGSADLGNVVWACRFHNSWVEDNPDRAHALGLVVRFGETVDDAWTRMHAAGLAVRPEPSPVPHGLTVNAGISGSLCSLCGSAGAVHRIGRHWYCPTCCVERVG